MVRTSKTCPHCGEENPDTVCVQPVNKGIDEYYCVDCITDPISKKFLKTIKKVAGEDSRIKNARRVNRIKSLGLDPVFVKSRYRIL